MTEPEQKLADRLELLEASICSEPSAAVGDDAADLAEAVARGYGSRFAFGPYRGVTQAIQRFRADGDAAAYQTSMEAALGAPNPQRACRIATFAVIGLEMANAFGANIPASVITEAIALENQVCGTPVPIPPLPPIPVPTPADDE